jgi:hypothetical protein
LIAKVEGAMDVIPAMKVHKIFVAGRKIPDSIVYWCQDSISSLVNIRCPVKRCTCTFHSGSR